MQSGHIPLDWPQVWEETEEAVGVDSCKCVVCERSWVLDGVWVSVSCYSKAVWVAGQVTEQVEGNVDCLTAVYQIPSLHRPTHASHSGSLSPSPSGRALRVREQEARREIVIDCWQQ